MKMIRRSLKNIAFAAATMALVGCVALKEGPALSSEAQFGSNHWYLCHKKQKTRENEVGSIVRNCNKPLILIGRASAFREFKGEDANKFYEKYKKYVSKIHPDGAPEISAQEFSSEYAGWSMLKGYGISGAVAGYEDVLITRKLRWYIDFPSSTATILYQGSGDLVAAATNPDGFFVTYKVLCQEDVDFRACAKKYPIGVFDATTGIQVDRSMEPIENGKSILMLLPQRKRALTP